MWRFSRKIRALITLAILVVGNTMVAFLVAAFIMPFGIIMGGTTGIGVILGNVFPGLDVALAVLILNVVLLFFGLAVLGKKFFLTTVVSSVIYPVALAVMERIPGITHLTDDPLLAAIFAGCLMGVAMGMVMRVGSSTGGMDVVVMVLHHWFHIPLSVLIYITDFLVMGGMALSCDSEQIMLGLLVLVLTGLVLDRTMIAGKDRVQVFIVSDRYEEIREALILEKKVGVTMLMAETGFKREKKNGIMCVISRRKVYDVTDLVCTIDPAAFITITKINEVRGHGFTSARVSLPAEEAGSSL